MVRVKDTFMIIKEPHCTDFLYNSEIQEVQLTQLNVNYYAAAKSIDTYSRLINSNTSGCCCR